MKAIKNFFWQMLAENGTLSSMRVGMFSLIFMAVSLIAAMVFYIIKRTILCDGLIDWNGLAALLGAIGLFLVPVLAGKVWQKRFENSKNETNGKPF